MPYDLIYGTLAKDIDAFIGSIPDEQLVIVPDPVTGKLLRSTFGQMKADIILAFGPISYLDPIVEVDTVADLPQPGAVRTLYVITTGADANTQWRWSGSMYIQFPNGVNDVTSEATIRGNADITLQANIDAEATARQAADITLQNNINTEASSRANADTNLTNSINAEANTRSNNDASLLGLINAEGVIRANIDATKVDKVAGMGLSHNDYTDAEKNKLAGLESSHYKGTYVNIEALQTAYPTASQGDYADVDAGAGADVERYIWDDTDDIWVLQQGAANAETAASIKTKYESNPDTNAFTDADKSKLDGIEPGAQVNDVTQAYVDNADQTLQTNIDAKADKTTKLTINGIQQDLSADREWVIKTSATGRIGCVESWSGSGLTFDVTPGTFPVQNTAYNFAGGSITLDPADVTYDRFDVLALNTASQLVKITGTPGANPDIPQIDPDTQFYITAIYVAAGATTPTNIDQTIIFDEHAEAWTPSAVNLTADFDNTALAFHLTKSIAVTAGSNGGYLKFVAGSAQDITNFTLLKFFSYLQANMNNHSNLAVEFWNGNSRISNTLPLGAPQNFAKNNSGAWQNISINFSDFTFTQSSFDSIRIVFTGSSFSAFNLDFIQLQKVPGSTTVVSVQDATNTSKGIIKLAGDLGGTADAPTVPALADKANTTDVNAALALKLDASAYNDRYKGKYTTLAALQAAYPAASAGDYAQVDAGAGSDVINYNYDVEDGWIEGGTGSAATNTDQLPEGASNLYFTVARVLATVLTGLSVATGGAIVSTDTILQAFGKLQNQINNLPTYAKALFSDLNTGTDDAKYATSLALAGSKYLDQSGAKISATASGTDTYTATISPAITAYATSQRFFIKFTNANTGAATLNLNSLGAKSLVKNGSTALSAGDIAAGAILIVAYDGTNFQIVGKISSGGGGASDNYATASGTNTYTAAITGLAAYTEGMSIRIKFTNANTGASTININSLGAINIYKGASIALTAGVITAGQIFELYYDGTVFQLGTVQVVPTTANKVITTDASGDLQAVNDLIDYLSSTTEATLLGQDWSNGYVTATGQAGQKVFGSSYEFTCTGTNTWRRTPYNLIWNDFYLGNVDDSAGIKTSTQMATLYPSAVQGQRVRGNAGVYEYFGLLGWKYTAWTS